MLKDFLMAKDINYQLIPPHVHQQNATVRAISMFKNHFIVGLCTSIELQVGTYGCSVYGVPYNFSRKAYKGML